MGPAVRGRPTVTKMPQNGAVSALFSMPVLAQNQPLDTLVRPGLGITIHWSPEGASQGFSFLPERFVLR